MGIVNILLPDFTLIALGFGLRRSPLFADIFWPYLEKLIYYVLFPALLFGSLARTQFDFHATARLLQVGLLFTVVGMILGYGARWFFKLSPMGFASSYQCAFRFNSYVGFAIMGGLHQSVGIAAIGLLIGILIPFVNAVAVWVLAHHGNGNLLKEVLRNPLIWATLSGLIFSVTQLWIPEPIVHTIHLLAEAALPLGLIAVGASLTLRGWASSTGPVAYFTVIKLIVIPAVAVLLVRWFSLSGVYAHAAIVLATLPVSSSAYILAVRMQGEGELVANIVAVNTIAAIVTIPLWLSLLGIK